MQGPRPFTAKGMCAECLMSIEGSKQAGNLYYKEHSHVLMDKIKLERCKADPNLYKKTWPDGNFIFIGVLVDNCLILPSNDKTKDWFLTEYRKYYTITGGDPVKKFNGVQVEQDTIKGTVTFHLKTYIEQVYRKYIPGPVVKQTAPVAPGAQGAKAFMDLKASDKTSPAMEDRDYSGLLGCVNYIVAQGRPDCMFHASYLAQFSQYPQPEHFDALVTVMRYLHHTRHLGITYGAKKRMLQPRARRWRAAPR